MKRGRSLHKLFILLCLAIIGIHNTFASDTNPKPSTSVPKLIHVGVIMDMPFAQNIDGHYSGIAVDIWERIAKINHWQFVYTPLSSNHMESIIDTLANSNNLDVVIGPISVSATRLEKVDFSRPFYLSSIGVISKRNELGILDIAHMLLSKNLLHIIIILILSFAAYLTLLWLFERNKAREGVAANNQYPSLTQRIWLHLFQKKVDYMPITTQGRIIGIFWVIIAAAIFTAINANFTSALTIARYKSSQTTSTLAGLQAAKVAGVKGQFNIEVAEKNGIMVTKVKDIEEAIRLLDAGKVNGIVSDTPVAVEYLRQHNLPQLILSPVILENDELAFAVKSNSPLRHAIDLGISTFQDDDSIEPLCKRYIGEEAHHCDI
ncbi:MAG TPA: transporter substrate-binding domain-containing protein [Burkholderiales bacterium]|nr:transporter substrate-binding domain-containing protein [Burkholderiales bacterium]